MTWTTFSAPTSKINTSSKSHKVFASLIWSVASTDLINIVPLGQLTKKFIRVLPFWSVQPSDITVHPVCAHDALKSSNLWVQSRFSSWRSRPLKSWREGILYPGPTLAIASTVGWKNGLFLTMLKGISLQRRNFVINLSACSFSVLFSIEPIVGCEPGVVRGTKNDDAATRLTDAAVEPVPLGPLPSADLFSCPLSSSLASLVCSNSPNVLMALWISSGFVFIQGPTSRPGICARWYFNLYTPPLISFPHNLQFKFCLSFGALGSPYSQKGSNFLGMFVFEFWICKPMEK